MKPLAFFAALALAASVVATAEAQTAEKSPTAPVQDGTVKRVKPTKSQIAPAAPQTMAPKLTAAEKRDKAKLDRDLKICIGC